MTVRTATLQGVPASRSSARNPKQTGTENLAARAEKVAAIAAAHAAAVDSELRFPVEAMAAAREHRLLGVAVPREFGGEGASVSEIADVCYTLGRACASTAMIYAMHQVKVACVVRHGRAAPGINCSCAESCATSCCSRPRPPRAPAAAMSATASADRARRASASPGEQPRLSSPTARRPTPWSPPPAARPTRRRRTRCWSSSRNRTTPSSGTIAWDTLGMRGTCSAGFTLRGTRRGRPDPADPLRRDPRSEHGAGRAYLLVQRLGRHRRRGGGAAPASSVAKPPAPTAMLPPERRRLHPRQRLAADACARLIASRWQRYELPQAIRRARSRSTSSPNRTS